VLLQKRMDLYAAEELERIVVSQGKGGNNLKSGAGEWKCARELGFGEHSCLAAYLVPGGRFLLSLTETSSVVYVDWNAPDLTWREIIPPSRAEFQRIVVSFEHVVGAPLVNIHVAIAVDHYSPITADDENPQLPSTQDVFVWCVSPQFDGKGVIVGLRSELLSRFRHAQKASPVQSINIQGDYLVLAQGYHPSCTCSVIRWTDVDGLTEGIPRKVVYQPSCHVRPVRGFNFHSSYSNRSLDNSSAATFWRPPTTNRALSGTLTRSNYRSVTGDQMLQWCPSGRQC